MTLYSIIVSSPFNQPYSTLLKFDNFCVAALILDPSVGSGASVLFRRSFLSQLVVLFKT